MCKVNRLAIFIFVVSMVSLGVGHAETRNELIQKCSLEATLNQITSIAVSTHNESLYKAVAQFKNGEKANLIKELRLAIETSKEYKLKSPLFDAYEAVLDCALTAMSSDF